MIAPVERVHVLHFGEDALELVAGLQRVPALQPRVVHLGIEHRRVLPLRIGRLASEVGEAGDELRGQAAGHPGVGRQAADAVGLERAGLPGDQRRRVLAGGRLRPAEAELEERRRARRPGGAERELLVRDVGRRIAAAARGQRNRRVVEDVDITPAPAREAGDRRVHHHVDLAAGLVGVVLEDLVDDVVVRGAGPGGRRQVVQHLTGEGAHRNRRAGRIDDAGEGMHDVHAQHALAVQRRRHRRDRRLAARLTEDLEVTEEERAVLHDGAADHGAVLVAVELRLLAVGGLEEAGGVEVGAAQEVPAGAAEPVGAAGVGHVDGGAGRAAVLGAHVVGDDLELGHRVGRRLHHLVREALVAGAVGVVVDAIDEEVVEGRPQTVHVERALARREAAGVQRREPHARRQQRELRVLAAVQRQGARDFTADHLAAVARIGLQLHGGRAHFHGLGDLADGHGDVHAQAGAHRHLHVVDDRDREAGLVGGDDVAADPHVGELVAAGGVGGTLQRHAVCDVGERDTGAGDDGAGAIADRADDGRGLELRGGQGRQAHADQEQEHSDDGSHGRQVLAGVRGGRWVRSRPASPPHPAGQPADRRRSASTTPRRTR